MIANSKSEGNFHAAAMKAFAFLFKYRQLAGDTIEANYNIARAYHHLGLFHAAIPLYEKVIRMSMDRQYSWIPGRQDLKEENESLEREAAFNLALIFKSSGNHELARRLLRDHVTI